MAKIEKIVPAPAPPPVEYRITVDQVQLDYLRACAGAQNHNTMAMKLETTGEHLYEVYKLLSANTKHAVYAS